MREKIRIELASENVLGRDTFYAELDLPATAQQIKDAKQRARFTGGDDMTYRAVSIVYFPPLPIMEHIRPDFTTIEELNYLAQRLDSLSEEQFIIYQALFDQRFGDEGSGELLPVKDLINMTYGLDSVMLVPNIRTDEELGQFVIENDLHPDIEAVPDESLYLLDKRSIGELQRQNDRGVFFKNCYIVTGDYELPEVYDGRNIPRLPENDVFRLKVGPADFNDSEAAEARAVWITLPIQREEADAIVNDAFGVASIEDCSCFDMESAIPSVTPYNFREMEDFDGLNSVAERYLSMSDAEQIKYKAILEADGIADINDAVRASYRLNEYELAYFENDAASFYKDFLIHHLDTRFDSHWLDTLITEDEGERLLERSGASLTEYGVLSSHGCKLFELVPYDDTPKKELKTQTMTDEKFQMVEVLGQSALFTNGRVTQKDLPDGLYKYDIRGGDDLYFATIEPRVVVNHSGTVITKEPIEFGAEGYIVFDDDSSPNFLGGHMTLEEFMDADFTEDEDESQTMGGMQL